MFINRSDAGRLLAEKLSELKGKSCVVLGVPRGGIPVAAEVASRLDFPLDVLFVKKIGHPVNKEYAIGAAGFDHEFIVPHHDVSERYLLSETEAVRKRLHEMKLKFKGDSGIIPLKGKTALIVDDGIATGNTLLAGIQVIRKQEPESIIIAAPVISRTAYEKLSKEAEQVITLMVPDYFGGVGAFFSDFHQVSDEEVINILRNAKPKNDHPHLKEN